MNEQELTNKINELKGKRECFNKRELLKAELKGFQEGKAKSKKDFVQEGINIGRLLERADVKEKIKEQIAKHKEMKEFYKFEEELLSSLDNLGVEE